MKLSQSAPKANPQIAAGVLVGGRFQVRSHLAEQDGSSLYQAQDTQGGTPVHLRVFGANGTTQSLAESDLGRASSVTDKNLATLVAWGQEGERFYVASEAVDGATVRQLVDARRSDGSVIGLNHAHVILGHVCNALESAHKMLVHGGINPETIRVTSGGRVKLVNLGLMRLIPGLSRRGGPVGNQPGLYLAPEVASGEEPSPAADVYSLAAVFYEMITGHAPGSPLWPPSKVNPAVPPVIDAVVARGMAPLPETRFSRPRELLDALGSVIASMEGGGVSAKPAEPPSTISVGKSFSVADAVRLTEEYERWLVQKDRLDYGPFSLAQVMAQMEKGIFTGDDVIVDVDSGDRQKIREHAQLLEFTRVTERRMEMQRRAQAEQAHEHVERKKGRWTLLIIGTAVLAVAAGVGWFIYKRAAAKDDVLASRISEADVDAFLKDVKISFAPPKRVGAAGRRPAGGNGIAGRAEDFNNNMDFGDVSQGGGDAILDEGKIDQVMRANYRRLVPCIMGKGVSTVEVDFVVLPTGRVKAVRVNGQGKGPLPMCILNSMQSFGFPPYKGKPTIANWSMSLR
jgi:eukaryotic-like serine/threonine-protein kinase